MKRYLRMMHHWADAAAAAAAARVNHLLRAGPEIQPRNIDSENPLCCLFDVTNIKN